MRWAGRERERISHLSNITETNDPRQTYLHITAPPNLQCESRGLMERNNKTIDNMGKT